MKKSYSEIRDFLDDDSFVQWTLSGRDEGQWRQFLAKYPEQSEPVERAQSLIRGIRRAEGLELPPLDQRLVWARVRAELRTPRAEKTTPTLAVSQYPLWQWVAGFALMLGLSWYAWRTRPGGPLTYRELVASVERSGAVVERFNAQASPLRVALEDGSVVMLAHNSKLSYPQHFGHDQRKVVLTGEGFFEVVKDADRPFYIYANEVVTKVLDTSFRIRAFENDAEVTVQVRTGRVQVFKQKRIGLLDSENSGLMLLPNQQAVISRIGEGISRRLVDEPVPLAAQDDEIRRTRYEEAPASQILRDLEDQYGITILFNDYLLNHCILTTTLHDESLYEKLDLICQTIGATYKEVDGQLVVESRGCF